MRKVVFFFALLAVSVFLSHDVCAGGAKIQSGSAVRLSYFFEADGVSMISQASPEEMKIVIGAGKYPPEFERQLIGLQKGDKRVITLSPDQAYGPHREELIRRVQKNQIPPAITLKEGMFLGGNKGQRPLRVVKVLDDSVVLDENHPLAGKKLAYHIYVADVQ